MFSQSLFTNFYFLSFVLIIVSFLLSYFATFSLRKFSLKNNIVDDPSLEKQRKKQSKPIPLLVGTGFCLVIVLIFLSLIAISHFEIYDLNFYIGEINWAKKLFFISLSVLVLLIGGYFDDTKRLKPIGQAFFVFLAVFIVVFFANILVLSPDSWVTQNLFYNQVLTFVWLVACISATKFLDGHDGLVATIGFLGFSSIASVAFFDYIQEPLLALVALICAFSIAGFLPFNFPNARVYLGEGASYTIGFLIGVLSILSSSKSVVAHSVIGFFIVDLFLVWVLRLLQKRNPLTSGDRLHWHHRLQDLGFNKFQVLIITSMIIIFTMQVYFLFRDQIGLSILFIQPVIVSLFFIFWVFKVGVRKK